MFALALIGAGVLGGCRTNLVQEVRQFFQAKGESYLKAGLRNYEDGRLPAAAENLRDALRAGLSESDEITANKYLAFIECAHKRERHCRAYFRRVLELQPEFELSAVEAGHPLWAPAFRALKGPK
jgi:Tfp pilus assembly protein PilF